MKPNPSEKQDAPDHYEKPAMVRPEHFIVNPEDPERWWRFGVKDDSPLGKAYDRGQLSAGRRGYTAEDRYGAGTIYRGIFASVHGSDCAVSNLARVSGATTEARASERLCVARDLLKRLHAAMSKDNAFIVERFCGHGAYASDAVRERYAGFDKSVYQGVCTALDDLIDAVLKLGLGKVSRGAT